MNKKRDTKSKGGKNVRLSKRDKQTVRFLKWVRRYSGWWYLICTPGKEHMTPGMMKMLVGRLAKARLYEIIFVMLTVHREAAFLEPVVKTMLLECILVEWQEEKGGERILHSLTELLT